MKRISLLVLWGFCSMALSNVSFHGYLVQPPNCTISNAQTIEITFQDVFVDDINGSNYEQTVPYSITCDTAVRDPSMEMTLSWSGTQSDFDDAAVSSNITGLGIQLKQAGQRFNEHWAVRASAVGHSIEGLSKFYIAECQSHVNGNRR